MSCGMIKNATVQLPEIQVVKTEQCSEQQACDSAHIAREAMETLHGNLMETEAAMETQAAPAFFLAALDGDAETVSKMLSTAGAQSLINYQHALGDTPLLTALGATPLLAAAANGHVAVTSCSGERQRESKSKWTRCVCLLLSEFAGGGGTMFRTIVQHVQA